MFYFVKSCSPCVDFYEHGVIVYKSLRGLHFKCFGFIGMYGSVCVCASYWLISVNAIAGRHKITSQRLMQGHLLLLLDNRCSNHTFYALNSSESSTTHSSLPPMKSSSTGAHPLTSSSGTTLDTSLLSSKRHHCSYHQNQPQQCHCHLLILHITSKNIWNVRTCFIVYSE